MCRNLRGKEEIIEWEMCTTILPYVAVGITLVMGKITLLAWIKLSLDNDED